jgi:hypothetical protein
MKVTAGFMAGEVYVAEDAANNYIGVAIWFGPGRQMFDWYGVASRSLSVSLQPFSTTFNVCSEDQLQEALQPFMSRFSTELQEWWEKWWDDVSSTRSGSAWNRMTHASQTC